MGFSWPTNKVWGGYVNPFSSQSVNCDGCNGTGYSPDAKRLSDEWYGCVSFDPVAYGANTLQRNPAAMEAIRALATRNYPNNARLIEAEMRRLHAMMHTKWLYNLIQADVDALVAAGRLMEFTRRPRNEEQAKGLGGDYWMRESNGYTPTADEVNAWAIGGMGHDSINQWVCSKARAKREGITQLECIKCSGHGTIWPSDKVRRQCDRWKPFDPPTGDGYQLWTTTNEGAPIGPVFATMTELCEWAANGATVFGHNKTTAQEWRRMLDADFVVHAEGNAVFM